MATIYHLHQDTPQQYSLDKITKALREGAVMLYPSDTVYAIGCDLQNKSAIERVRKLKRLSNDKPLTFLCSSLSNISSYAIVTDEAYRIMRHLVPGPYTFILPTTKLVPKLVMNPKRRTTGIRVPSSTLCQALLNNLGNPIISASAHLLEEEEEVVMPDKMELFDALDKQVDIIVDDGSEIGWQVSSIVDFSSDTVSIIRKGLGWEELEKWL